MAIAAQATDPVCVDAPMPHATYIVNRLAAIHDHADKIGAALQLCADRLTHSALEPTEPKVAGSIGAGNPVGPPFSTQVEILLDKFNTALHRIEKAGDQISRFTGQ